MKDINDFLYSKMYKERSVSSTFVILSNISDNLKEKRCTQSSTRDRGVDKYKEKGVFKVNKGGKYEPEV